MPIVRFQSVIAAAGKPRQHLLWTDPKEDKELQKALKEQRVLTLHQSTINSKADYGTVGLDKKPQGQILIFPRSLEDYAGKRIVGVNYDLYTDAPVKRVRPTPKPKPAPRPEPKEKPARKSATKKLAPTKRSAKTKQAKILHFPAAKSPAPEKPSADLAQIKRKVRQALKALEQGKQVAAYELLKEIAK